MYLRAVHAEVRLSLLIELIQQHPLGILTTALQSEEYPVIQHTHVPWVLDPPSNLEALEADGQVDAEPVGNVKRAVVGLQGCKLRGHLARANPHAKALIEAASNNGGRIATEVTVSFSSPNQHYVTPKWYSKTKPATGKVVPTWDYAAVEVRGFARVFCDKESPESSEYLQKQINDLTQLSEGSLGYDTTPKVVLAAHDDRVHGKGPAWEVADAPIPYINIMKKAIVGVEVEVTSMVGKWKMSQELTEGDCEGVKTGLRSLASANGQIVADIVQDKRK